MDTYGSLIRDAVRSLLDQIRGRSVTSSTQELSYGEAQTLLENTAEVQVTRVPVGVAPATTHTLEGAATATAWADLRETYELAEPTLEMTLRGDDLTYEIRARYGRDGVYAGEYRFRSEDADALWATFNDI